MDRALVRTLRARGVDVTTALDEGMIERSDAEHLDYATAQGRVLYMLYADFLSLGVSGQRILWVKGCDTKLLR